jgi:hypothetical protein
VSTPDRRARDKDRDAAIAVVEAAWADGQIIEADRDRRVAELQRAQTLAEIDVMTRGLRGAVTEAPEPPVSPAPPVSPYAAAPVAYGPPTPELSTPVTATAAKLPKALLLIPFVVILLVAVGIVSAVVAVSSGDNDVSVFGDSKPKGHVLSAEGYDEVVAAVEDESGSTAVFDAVFYPEYAVVSIPADGSSQRQESFYWDGSDLSSNDSKSTASGIRFDLTRVEGQTVIDLVDRVKLLVEDPVSWYAIVRAPDGDRSMIWAYATNEYGETAYLGARRDGTVVYDSTEH